MAGLLILVAGARVGVVLVLGWITLLHFRFNLPVKTVEIAIILYVTLLALAVGVPAYFLE